MDIWEIIGAYTERKLEESQELPISIIILGWMGLLIIITIWIFYEMKIF